MLLKSGNIHGEQRHLRDISWELVKPCLWFFRSGFYYWQRYFLVLHFDHFMSPRATRTFNLGSPFAGDHCHIMSRWGWSYDSFLWYAGNRPEASNQKSESRTPENKLVELSLGETGWKCCHWVADKRADKSPIRSQIQDLVPNGDESENLKKSNSWMRIVSRALLRQ